MDKRRRPSRQHGSASLHCQTPSTETRPQLARSELAAAVTALDQGERLVMLGVGRDGIGEIVSERAERGRGILLVACEGRHSVAALVDGLLDDLADLVLARWPQWHGGRERAADPWLKAAAKRITLGLRPRFRRMAREVEFGRLLTAIEPGGPVLVWEIDPASPARARPAIEALEWCTRHRAAVVAGLAAEPPETAPYDRVLYGARELAPEALTAAERFIAPTGAHHASVIEQRMAAALEQDAELQGHFVCNAPVAVGHWGTRRRVDLLCASHRVVVELDGPEHRAEPKFSDYRHRDYELLTAGYLVLRLTNDQVATDLPLAIEKIRSVVRLRRISDKGLSR